MHTHACTWKCRVVIRKASTCFFTYKMYNKHGNKCARTQWSIEMQTHTRTYSMCMCIELNRHTKRMQTTQNRWTSPLPWQFFSLISTVSYPSEQASSKWFNNANCTQCAATGCCQNKNSLLRERENRWSETGSKMWSTMMPQYTCSTLRCKLKAEITHTMDAKYTTICAQIKDD